MTLLSFASSAKPQSSIGCRGQRMPPATRTWRRTFSERAQAPSGSCYTPATQGTEDALTLEPKAERPHMPAYGILQATEGTGLLPWTWTVERLPRSHDYWLANGLARWPSPRHAGLGRPGGGRPVVQFSEELS